MQHQPRLKAAFYADPNDGTVLHRYLDEQFVQRYWQDAARGRLTANCDQAWRQTDRFGNEGRDLVTLRQPIHRAFYMVSCEICCDQLGDPAFDPGKVQSAGMVIRRGDSGKFKAWQVREGRAIGWRDLPAEHASLDPDHYRRLRQRKLVTQKGQPSAYSGEQTHPMNPTLVERSDSQGRTRKHTLLSGFLALGGAVEAQPEVSGERNEASAPSVSASGQLAEFEWPFGSWDGVSDDIEVSCVGPLDQVAEDFCGQFSWQDSDAFQVMAARPSNGFVHWLRTLLERFHVHDASNPDNAALRNQLGGIYFYAYIGNTAKRKTDFSLTYRRRQHSLLYYVERELDQLLEWFAERERGVAQAEMPGLDVNQDLFFSESQAAALREQIVLRSEQAEKWVEASLPLPRFGQSVSDVYFVKPFVRYLDDGGCEQIAWGPESELFRVASVLDPEAARPSIIQLPELGDLKRGFAKGVTFLTPQSLANKLEQISPDLDFSKKSTGNRLQACLGFSISFSIPIITICAMVLLMVILNVLNFFFRWLPWAILKLPRRCG